MKLYPVLVLSVILVTLVALINASFPERDKFNKYEIRIKMGKRPFKIIKEADLIIAYAYNKKTRFFDTRESVYVKAKNITASKEYVDVIETDIDLEDMEKLMFFFSIKMDLVGTIRGGPKVSIESIKIIKDPDTYVNVYLPKDDSLLIREFKPAYLDLVPEEY